MYSIVDVDYYEWDAFLCIEGCDKRFWFSYNGAKISSPTLADAIDFFERDPFKESKTALAKLKELGLYS